MIAALFVARGGCYWDLEGVDPWDEGRDARLYPGAWPVVAHPPCARWCRLAGLVEARWGHQRGDDGGCFAAALAAVRRWGGVLEHPAWSDAWHAHDLPHPDPSGGWQRDIYGGWCCHVEQRWYGHRARKATWLYAVGVRAAGAALGARSSARSVRVRVPRTSRRRLGMPPIGGRSHGPPRALRHPTRVPRRAARDGAIGCAENGCSMRPERLTRARQLAGLTRVQAVRLLGRLNTQSLRDIETGYAEPDDQMMRDLATLYGVPLEWLTGHPPLLSEETRERLHDCELAFAERKALVELLGSVAPGTT